MRVYISLPFIVAISWSSSFDPFQKDGNSRGSANEQITASVSTNKEYKWINIYKYENTTTYSTANLISSHPSDKLSHKTNTNLADVRYSEITYITTQETELNRKHGFDMGILTSLQWEIRNDIFNIRPRRKFRRYLPAGSTLQNPFQA